jgi:uncharacterized membrane protein
VNFGTASAALLAQQPAMNKKTPMRLSRLAAVVLLVAANVYSQFQAIPSRPALLHVPQSCSISKGSHLKLPACLLRMTDSLTRAILCLSSSFNAAANL